MEESQQTYLVNEKNWSPWMDSKCHEAPYTSENVPSLIPEGASMMMTEEKCLADQEEKFGDSLHQLNKIVERISPDSSGVSYQNFSQHQKQLSGNMGGRLRPSYASSFTESVSDSAYETFAGDNSYDCSNEGQFVEHHHHRNIGDAYMDLRGHSQWQQTMNEWQQDPRMMKAPSMTTLYQKPGDVYGEHMVVDQMMGSNYNSCDSNKISKTSDCLPRDFSYQEDHHKPLYNYSAEKDGRKQSRQTDNQFGDLSGRDFRYGSNLEFEQDKSMSSWQLQGTKNFLEIGKYTTEERSSLPNKAYDNYSGKPQGGSKPSQCLSERHISSDLASEGRNSSDEDDGKGDGEGGGRQTFTCSHCNFGASKKGQLRKHMSMHGVFLCAHCEFASEIAEVLEDHRRMSHPGLCGRKLCKKCRVLYQGDELEEHEKICSGEKQHWTCPVCHKEFKFLSVMKAHARKWHPNETSLLMSNTMMMGSSSHQESSWRTSAADSTTGEMTPDNDSSRAPSGEDFHSAHFDGHRSCFIDKKAGPKKAPEHGYYKTNHDKMAAMPVRGEDHSNRGGSYNVSDEVCSAGETPPLEVPFFCDFESCCTTFRSDKELNVHRMSIHGLPPKRYHCRHPDCSMQFAKYGHYKRHQLSHAGGGEKKFKCDWPNCGKAFCHTDNLKVHYRRHTDEKPYKCDKCASSYRQKSGLKYHLEKAHDEKSTGRPGRKRKNAGMGMEEPAPYASSKWDSQEFPNYHGKEQSGYGKNLEPMKIPEPVQMRFDRSYGPPGPNHKNMPSNFHSFYDQPDPLMKVKPFGPPHKSDLMKMDHHMGGWNLGKPLHLEGMYQEPLIPGMRNPASLNGGFPGMDRGQTEDFYLPKPSPYCTQNPSNIVMNYMDEMNSRSNNFVPLPLMNKGSLEHEMASSSEDEWTAYQHIKPPILHGSIPENLTLGEHNLGDDVEVQKNEEAKKIEIISESKSFVDDKMMRTGSCDERQDFEDIKREGDGVAIEHDGEINVEESKGKSSDKSDADVEEGRRKELCSNKNEREGGDNGGEEDDDNDQSNSEEDSKEYKKHEDDDCQDDLKATIKVEDCQETEDGLRNATPLKDEGENEELSIEKLEKSVEENNSESVWKEREGQSSDMCWAPSSEIGSMATSKGWPRVLDASLTESHSPNEHHKNMNIFEQTDPGSPNSGFNRSDAYDKIRNLDRSSFGASNYQLPNDYSSRHPLLNDNYCFSPSAAANPPYGNVYNFSSNMRRAGGCLDAFGGPLFPSGDRSFRGEEHDYRDSSLRIGTGYNSFLHSSPYPYDPRHYHSPDNPIVPPGSYDFAYPSGSLPPFPPPPPPPSFSLTRPWTGEFEPMSGNESLKSPGRLYQPPYGQSSSLNRYF